MDPHKTFPAILLTAVLLGGCSAMGERYYPRPPSAHPGHEAALAVAQELIGSPYRYGGDHPSQGFDCSGLVYFSHLQAGIELPRTARQQFSATHPVGRGQLRAGDLVFFRIGRRAKISHVGIYIGGDAFVHAPSSGKQVQIGQLSDPYWDARFIRGGRLPGAATRRTSLFSAVN